MATEEQITLDFNDGERRYKIRISKNEESRDLPESSKDYAPMDDGSEQVEAVEHQLEAKTAGGLTRALKKHAQRGRLRLWCNPEGWDKIVFEILDLRVPLPEEPVPWPRKARKK